VASTGGRGEYQVPCYPSKSSTESKLQRRGVIALVIQFFFFDPTGRDRGGLSSLRGLFFSFKNGQLMISSFRSHFWFQTLVVGRP
jgi:hypothetical protein